MNPLTSSCILISTFLFLLLLLLPTAIHPAQLPWTRYLINDTVPALSIKTEFYNTVTGANLTVQCTIVRLCLSSYVAQCSQPNTVRWFTPRTLVDTGDKSQPLRKEITFNSSVVDTFHRPNISGEISEIRMLLTLKLDAIGFIHAGYYECSSVVESQEFTLRVAENAAQRCTYGDQCTSGSCWEGSCRCSGPQYNWVPATKSCVKRVPIGGGGCASDAECAIGGGSLQALMPISGFAQHLAPIRCLANGNSSAGNSCQCDPQKDVKVGVAVAEVDVCLPRASLGATCYSSAQCTATTGAGAFCGLNPKTVGKRNSSASENESGTSSEPLVCQCADGWHPSFSGGEKTISNAAGDSCSPYTRCNSSVHGFNEHFIQGSCPRNQFCRSPGYCLCLPNWEFASGGSCVLQRGMDMGRGSGSSFLEQYFWQIMVCIVAVVVVVFSLAMLQVVRSKLGGGGGGCKRRKSGQTAAQRGAAVRMSMVNRGNSSSENNSSSRI